MHSQKPVHPGKLLFDDFLEPLGISAYKLSKDIGIPQTRISEILKGNRRITADTALRLAKYFDNTPQYWLFLQDNYDLSVEAASKKEVLRSIKKHVSTLA